MSCPTCDHTMQNVGAEGQRIFWCPRCGTLSTFTGEHRKDEPPSWMRRLENEGRDMIKRIVENGVKG